MGKFKWSNIPILEGHVIPLVVGIAWHVWRPLEFWQAVLESQVSGWTLLMIGILLALWGAVTSKDMDFEKPSDCSHNIHFATSLDLNHYITS